MPGRSEFARAAFERLRDQVLMGPERTGLDERYAAAMGDRVDPALDPLLHEVRERAFSVTDVDVARAEKVGEVPGLSGSSEPSSGRGRGRGT